MKICIIRWNNSFYILESIKWHQQKDIFLYILIKENLEQKTNHHDERFFFHILNITIQLYINSLNFMLSQQSELQKANIQKIPTLKIVDGRYQIKDKLLGKGSFASTYLCIDTKTGNVIACKMVSKKHLIQKINLSKNKSLTKEYFIHSLKTQVKTWKSIHHKNIVQFIDFSQTPNNIYFFLEYCAGGNLENLLRNQGAYPQNKSIQFMIQLVNGCQYLYQKGIYHRDLKTQNILIHEGQLKLSDFGFAKVVESQEIKNNPTQQTSVGTPIYMSPQVLLGDPYTIKCDVWSLGVVFYKMLYNIYPWEKTDNLMVLTKRMKQTINFPPNPKVSNWVKQLIKGMLNVDQSKRLYITEVKKIIQANTNSMDIQ